MTLTGILTFFLRNTEDPERFAMLSSIKKIKGKGKFCSIFKNCCNYLCYTFK